MPNVDGLEVLKYLKGNEITKYIPFVFLSFKSDVEQEIRGYELGGDAYISKPFHPKHLLAVVHQILNNRLSLRGLLQFRDLLVGRLRGGIRSTPTTRSSSYSLPGSSRRT